MNGNQILLGIIIFCIVVLTITLLVKNVHVVVNIVLRTVMGVVGIFVVNNMIAAMGISMTVGLNPYTAGVVGVLGFPGFVTLYLLSLYRIVA